jgi:predicted N-acetyltransferase YhbS
MQLVRAEGPLLEQALDVTFDLWGEGLTRNDYARYNAAQLQTPWSGTKLIRLALVENGTVLATAKKYLLNACIDGQMRRVLGIGAVFTPPNLRRRGLARALIERMIDEARTAGIDAALLFSEIGPDYYARIGFTPVPMETLVVRVSPGRGGAPAVAMRAGDARDLEWIAEISARMSSQFRFALDRPSSFIQYGLTKKRLLAGLTRGADRGVEFYVVEEGARPVAYVVITFSPTGRMIEECGDRDPTGARVGAMLQALELASPSRGEGDRLTAWLPPGFVPPQLSVVGREPARDVMMTRGIAPPLAAGDVIYWHGDVF